MKNFGKIFGNIFELKHLFNKVPVAPRTSRTYKEKNEENILLFFVEVRD